MDECEITIEISIKDIIWMLDHPDELDIFEKSWIDTFKELWKEAYG